jgi:SAM-dependent methyltransferase
LVEALTTWHLTCPQCFTEYSALSPRINDASVATIDESARAQGLAAVRAESYRYILDALMALPHVGRSRLLEVGSAHGWFLSAAADRFDAVVGIEPDDAVRRAAANRRITVRPGFFPDALQPGEAFDVIAFNDVFEHIPQSGEMAKAIAAHLSPRGVALINVPVSNGFVYRCSKALFRCGFPHSFERMWQLGYPSPHVRYFAQANITRLFSAVGLQLAAVTPLPTLKTRGLWQRIRYGEPSLAKAATAYAAALALAPVLRVLPHDTVAFFFRPSAH